MPPVAKLPGVLILFLMATKGHSPFLSQTRGTINFLLDDRLLDLASPGSLYTLVFMLSSQNFSFCFKFTSSLARMNLRR